MASCTDFSLATPGTIRVRLPGGATITGVSQGAAPTDLDAVRALGGQVAALLGPYQGIFEVIDTVTLVLETIRTIPEAILTFSPGKISDALSKLSAKVSSLATFLPAVAVPILAKDIIELVSRNNSALRTEIKSLQVQESGAAQMRTRADELLAAGLVDAASGLFEGAGCLEATVTSRVAALNTGQGPLDSLVGVVNALLGLLPGTPIPELPLVGSLPDDLTAAITVLDSVDEALKPIRAALSGI